MSSEIEIHPKAAAAPGYLANMLHVCSAVRSTTACAHMV